MKKIVLVFALCGLFASVAALADGDPDQPATLSGTSSPAATEAAVQGIPCPVCTGNRASGDPTMQSRPSDMPNKEQVLRNAPTGAQGENGQQ